MNDFQVVDGVGIIPYGTTIINERAFCDNDELRHVVIPDSVKLIGSSAFRRCRNLESVIIPYSVSYIGVLPFSGCDSLKSIVIDKENAVYDSRNDCNAIIESATGKLIVGCSNTIIPDGVLEIGERAFVGMHSMTHVNIPKTVWMIRKLAFGRCTNLLTVGFEGQTRLEGKPFAGCTKLSYAKLNSFKEIRCARIDLPKNGVLMESSVYIAYDGSLYWVLDKNYCPVISSISPEMKYLSESLMAIKLEGFWQLCVPDKYSCSVEYCHDHQFASCELVASNCSTLTLRDDSQLYLWSSSKRKLSKSYDTIEAISKWNPYYIVSRDRRYGLVNSNLDLVVACEYDTIQPLGKYLVYSTGSLFGLMSTKGDVILQPKYSSIEEFGTQFGPLEEYLKISCEGKWGYYGHNLHQSVLLEPEYDNIIFKQGWFIVESNGRIGLVDNSCTHVLSCIYDEIYDFSYSRRYPSLEFLTKKVGKYGLVNGDGHVILPFQYDSIVRVFSDDYKCEYWEEYSDEEGNSLYKDRSFMAHEVVYQMVRDEDVVFSWARYGNGYWKLVNPSFYIFVCQYNGRWGVLDADGNNLIPFEYDEIEIDKLCNRKTKHPYKTEKYLRCFVRKSEGPEITKPLDLVLL